MIINLIKFIGRGGRLREAVGPVLGKGMGGYAGFGAGKDRDGQGKGEEKESKEEGKPKPKVIEISKQQFVAMKKFLQDIRMSMPMPDITPFTPNPKPSAQYQEVSPLDEKSYTSPYFSTEQQILSFKLLKLSEPQQFGPVFEQHRNDPKLSNKLIILHRYLSAGGGIGKGRAGVQGLAYCFMEELVKGMRGLEEGELGELLGLYLGVYREQIKLKDGPPKLHQLELPTLNIEGLQESQLPLISTPSHTSTRVLVLLLKFWEIQSNTKPGQMSKSARQGLEKILQHYQLCKKGQQEAEKQPVEYPQPWQYPINQLAYIGLWAYSLNLQSSNAIPLLIQNLKHSNNPNPNLNSTDQDPSHKISKKRLIRTAKVIVENYGLLDRPSAKIVGILGELKDQLVGAVDRMTRVPDSQEMEQVERGLDEEDGTLMDLQLSQCSGQISSLLYFCLLTLHDKPTSTPPNPTIPLTQQLLHNLPLYLSTTQSLPLLQYSEYWQSSMVLFKLLKANSKIATEADLYKLVDCFMGKVRVEEAVKGVVQEESEAVVEELVLDCQRRLFQCLVGYRMVVPVENSDKVIGFTNIVNQIDSRSNEKGDKTRLILQSLLTGYRKTIQTLHSSSLLSPASPIIHNLILACMIAEAYPHPSSSSSSSATKTMFAYLQSQAFLQVLREYGRGHARFGAYVGKLLGRLGQNE